ncbi:MAG TPA: hypothetical protein PLJ23_12130 [Gemmatimonadales bacterium]|nr:hypothetical protein [Gemmatimonadales bacterium]
MITKVQKWRNSPGIQLDKATLSAAGLEVGDEVGVVVMHGAIVVTPVRRARAFHDLHDLVRRLPKGARRAEVSWGAPVGFEFW